MTASTTGLKTPKFDLAAFSTHIATSPLPLAAGAKLVQGCLVALDASGNLVNATASTAITIVGVMDETVDNTSGGAAALYATRVRAGIFGFQNSAAGDAISNVYVSKPCYCVDNNTVALTSGSGTRPIAGRIVHVSSQDSRVYVSVGPTELPVPQTDVATYVIAADGAANTTTAETAIFRFPTAALITSVKLTPTGAATASDTLYATLTFAKRDGAGGAAATVVAPTTKTAGSGGTGSLVAFTTVDAGALTGAAVAAGTVLTYTEAKASTGTQLSSIAVSINYIPFSA